MNKKVIIIAEAGVNHNGSLQRAKEMVKAAKAAHIHGYISRLPAGYNTVLTDNGASISKGQKQLLTIARAMLLDAHMLILDEATSALDSVSESAIQDALDVALKGRTSIVIAHRLSTIMAADQILALCDGVIAQSGTHEELLKQEGIYQELFETQFGRMIDED